MLARQAPQAGHGVAQPAQIGTLALGIFQVCLGGSGRSVQPQLEISLALYGQLQDLLPVGGGGLGPDERLVQLAPVVETHRDLLQLFLRGVGIAGVLLCFFRRLCREPSESCGLTIQGIHYLVELAVLELPVAGGPMVLGAALDGLPCPVYVLRLTLVGRGRPPPGRSQLAQSLLLLAQLALPRLQVLTCREE